MSASAVYVLDLKGKVLICRNYRGDVDMSEVEHFMPILMEKEEEGMLSPILAHGGVRFMWIKHNNLYWIPAPGAGWRGRGLGHACREREQISPHAPHAQPGLPLAARSFGDIMGRAGGFRWFCARHMQGTTLRGGTRGLARAGVGDGSGPPLEPLGNTDSRPQPHPGYPAGLRALVV